MSGSTGSAQGGFNATKLGALEIPVPPLTEQQRIVRILDEAFESIAQAKANTEKNLQNARALFDNHLESVFGAPDLTHKPVAQIAKHSLGKMLDKSKNKGAPEPYLRNLNVRWFVFDLSDVLKMRFQPDELERYSVRQGDVVVCEGGYPGRAAIWAEQNPIFFQKALHRVRFHDRRHSKWFVYYLYSQEKCGGLRRNFSGTGIQHFTGEALAAFNVPLPPETKLEGLIAGIEEIQRESHRLESIYKQKLGLLVTLEKSLLNQAFTGNL
jgi:type I restriction enzyme S subunit